MTLHNETSLASRAAGALPAHGSTLLQARDVFKNYGPIKVLKNVNLDLAQGERHVVIGPNGAGKSTLFKVLSGELPPTSGTITLRNEDVSTQKGYRRVRKGVGRSFQVARVFLEMTALDNVAVSIEAREANCGRNGGFLALSTPRAIIDEALGLLSDLGLYAVKDTQGAVLAHGDRKRLELAMSLALKPKILMLDEPTAGMSPTDRAAAVNLIDRIVRDNQLSLLLTEHDMGVVFQLGTRLSVLHYGEVVVSGEPDVVRADPLVREIYLGRKSGHA
ncbi:ABC transporter ATP-binding protein [Tianweitania sediminis]|uniref:ABC transporter ATP-binding protein n=1 Tax=Tianweitania sediminis TaxID=1502156 RepID=A0A8J7QYI4_9HYPH|nr:ABC transporter ATP-binding protein [Tianweitania sediminis]MBP0438305.1 ABC transporter ATP-binding protein [Tianweitania sediminis]